MYSEKSMLFSWMMLWLIPVLMAVGGTCLANSPPDNLSPVFVGRDAVGSEEGAEAPNAAPDGSPRKMGVRVDFSLIEPGAERGEPVRAELPDGGAAILLRKAIEVRREHDYTWIGRVDGHELSTVVLTVVNGFLQGHIDMDGKTYSIEPEGHGYVIVKGDSTMVPPFMEDAVEPDRLPDGTIRDERPPPGRGKTVR